MFLMYSLLILNEPKSHYCSTTKQLPCILWLKIKKPKTFSLSWFINWVSHYFIQ